MSAPDPKQVDLPEPDFVARSEPASMTTRNFPVHVPQKDANETIIEVRSSVLRKARRRLSNIRSQQDKSSELYLAAASLCIGGTISAGFGSVELSSFYGKIAYIVMPIVAVFCMTVFYFGRKEKIDDNRLIAMDILEDLPDPDEPGMTNEP